jgi:hypothetical protein
MPFYDGRVEYAFTLKSKEVFTIRIPREAWEAACIEISHAGTQEVLYGPDITFSLDGTHYQEFSIRLYGLPQSVFGPWHYRGDMRKRALPSFWNDECKESWNAPAGEAYILLQQGLIANQLRAISSTAEMT